MSSKTLSNDMGPESRRGGAYNINDCSTRIRETSGFEADGDYRSCPTDEDANSKGGCVDLVWQGSSKLNQHCFCLVSEVLQRRERWFSTAGRESLTR